MRVCKFVGCEVEIKGGRRMFCSIKHRAAQYKINTRGVIEEVTCALEGCEVKFEAHGNQKFCSGRHQQENLLGRQKKRGVLKTCALEGCEAKFEPYGAQMFCSGEHRKENLRKEYFERKKKRKVLLKTCALEVCEIKFEPHGDQRFCTKAHYQKDHALQKKLVCPICKKKNRERDDDACSPECMIELENREGEKRGGGEKKKRLGGGRGRVPIPREFLVRGTIQITSSRGYMNS